MKRPAGCATATRKRAALKTRPNEASVAAFIRRITDPQRRADCEIVLTLMQQATGQPPKMWGASIVGFGTYQYRYASGREGDWMRIGFSPRAQALTLYLMPGFEDAGALLARLGRHRLGKSCLYVDSLAQLDLPTLKALIEQSVQRMALKYGA